MCICKNYNRTAGAWTGLVFNDRAGRSWRLFAVIAAVVAAHFSCLGAPVTYWFNGVVEGFQNVSNVAPAGIGVGTPFAGRISYDPAGWEYAETNSFSGGVGASYRYANLAAFSFTVYIAGHTISNTAVTGSSGQIELENNVSGRDFYLVETGSDLKVNGTNFVAAPNQSAMSIGLIDENATALTSVGVPLAAPVLNRYSEGGYLTILARNANGSKDLCSIRGPIAFIRTNEIVALSLRRLNASTAQLAWPAYATGYTLQSSASLSSPNWQNVLTPAITVGQEQTVTVSTTGTPRFYRLKK